MKRLFAAALLLPAFFVQPAMAAAEKSSTPSSPVTVEQEQEPSARPAIDIKLRIRSRWADLSVRINFG
jgi:hypothetical protein